MFPLTTAMLNSVEAVELLLDRPDLDVSLFDTYGMTVLHWACMRLPFNQLTKGRNATRDIIRKGADVNAKYKYV